MTESPPRPLFNQVAIYGVGLIGGSLGAALRAQRIAGEVIGCGRNRANLEVAVERGLVDRFETDVRAAAEGAELVVLATPLSAIEPLLESLAQDLAADACVTDVGSVKAPVIEAVRRAAPGCLARFVPGHPIAGSERSGAWAADARLFCDHRVILTPTEITDASAVDRIAAMWRRVGALPEQMSPQDHDEVLAATSHLPHLLAFALVEELADGDTPAPVFRYAAGGFRDFTRIASSDPRMWRDIFSANRLALSKQLARYQRALGRWQQWVEQDDGPALQSALQAAKSARDRWQQGDVPPLPETPMQEEHVHFVAEPGGALHGEVRVPGDKSISHRAIMLGALGEGSTRVQGFLPGEDTLATLKAFQQMGVEIHRVDATSVEIEGVGLHGLRAPNTPLDLGNSGTSMRLLCGLLAAQNFDTTLTGDASLTRRPMNRVVEPLRAMGADIETATDGRPPLSIHGRRSRLVGMEYQLPMASAQVKSALLLAGLYARGTTTVLEGEPTRDHTERMLTGCGYAVSAVQDGPFKRISVAGGGRLAAMDIEVPSDISSAAFFLVGASIAPGSDLRLPGVGLNPTRTGVIDILRLMGADIEVEREYWAGGEPVGDLRVRHAPLRGIDIPEALVPLAIDEFPAILVAAATAEGSTRLSGAGELRVKESDRIQAMADGLSALGIENQVYPDGIRIQGGTLGGGRVDSLGDHRIAMAFSMAALRASGPVTILNCANVATSFPSFIALATESGLRIHLENSLEAK